MPGGRRNGFRASPASELGAAAETMNGPAAPLGVPNAARSYEQLAEHA